MIEIISKLEIEKLCNLLECSSEELKVFFEDSKKINDSSRTIYHKVMNILQKGTNVREAALIGVLCGYQFGYSIAKKKIEEDIKNKLFNAFKNSNLDHD